MVGKHTDLVISIIQFNVLTNRKIDKVENCWAVMRNFLRKWKDNIWLGLSILNKRVRRGYEETIYMLYQLSNISNGKNIVLEKWRFPEVYSYISVHIKPSKHIQTKQSCWLNVLMFYSLNSIRRLYQNMIMSLIEVVLNIPLIGLDYSLKYMIFKKPEYI